MPSNVTYWLQGRSVQNLGDFLSEFLRTHLFYGEGLAASKIRIIGSCIDDMFVERPRENGEDCGSLEQKVIFWGCGLRQEGGLCDANRETVEILSVRGPLTRSALRLGMTVPFGDPGLLLPALYQPGPSAVTRSAAILVPHFHDHRADDELLQLSGCDQVLRPNIANDFESIRNFLDQLNAADFVLCASLHAAVAAAAYGRPFGFWDSGNVDLPFKWYDFAASLSIPCAFFATLAPAVQHYGSHIREQMRIPPLWPSLMVAPFPVRMQAFVRVIKRDVERHGAGVFELIASQRVATRIELEQVHALEALRLAHRDLQAEVASRATEANQLRATLDERTEDANQLRSSVAEYSQGLTRLRLALEQRSSNLRKLEARLTALRLDAAGERRSTQKELAQRNRDVDHLQGLLERAAIERNELQSKFSAVISSKSWRATIPLRKLTEKAPFLSRNLQRIAKLVWWVLSLKLLQKLKLKWEIRTQIAILACSDLLDQTWYFQQHPDVASANESAAEHYFWFGATAGYDPHLLFDTSWYVERYPEVASRGLNPLVHYLKEGAAAGYHPHPLFDTSWYVERYPEATKGGLNPLVHYLKEGAAAGYDPHPLFDASWYVSHGAEGDHLRANPLLRYLEDGPAGRYDPNPWFDNDKYVFEHSEVRSSEEAPLVHYLQLGVSKKYDPHPLFDAAWYGFRYGDLLDGKDALTHFLTVGFAQGCVPSALFEDVPCDEYALRTLTFPTFDQPDVSIVIPVAGKYFETYRCLCSLMLRTGCDVPYEVIVADDCPKYPLTSALDESSGIITQVNPENLGFLRNCNRAAERAKGHFIVFLNNDTIVGRDWLKPLVKIANEDPTVGMVGGKLLNTDGTIQEAGGIIFNDGWGMPYGAGDDRHKCEYNYVREVDCVIGACFLVRRDLFKDLGGFDLRYAPAFYEEFDLAFAASERGYKIVYQPATEITHRGSQTYGHVTRDKQSRRNHLLFVDKWRKRLDMLQPNRSSNLFIDRESSRARQIILVIDDKPPEYDRHAGALTMYQYLLLFRSMGLRTIFCPDSHEPLQPYTSVLQQHGIEVLYRPESLPHWLEHNGFHLDYVLTARPDVSAKYLDLVQEYTTAKLFYYTHDLHYLRELRRYEVDGDPRAREESERYKKLEFQIFRQVDCVMTPSSEEVRVIQREIPEANVIEILPYFYPPIPLTAPTDFTGRDAMIFVGGFDHLPNVDAVVWLTKEILPLVWHDVPDARLLIVGNKPPAAVKGLQCERVVVTGYVPDLTPYYDLCRLSVNPLRYGAGVKGKIVGSLRAGIPVVTTSVGNEGIGLADGLEALVGDSASELAKKIISLYRDNQKCQALADAGRSVINRRFSVAKARSIMEQILNLDRGR
jgi:GT2 family glycosyltransferase